MCKVNRTGYQNISKAVDVVFGAPFFISNTDFYLLLLLLLYYYISYTHALFLSLTLSLSFLLGIYNRVNVYLIMKMNIFISICQGQLRLLKDYFAEHMERLLTDLICPFIFLYHLSHLPG